MIKKISLFFLFFFITMMFLEFFIQSSEIDSLSISKNDSINGSILKQNKDLIYFNEGFYMGETNKFGYYGPSYPENKDSLTLRIALVGDSYVEGHQVFDRNHFRSLLENALSKKIGKKVEVLNFGMSGFNLNDDYCYYKNLVYKFNPDLVLFFLSNEDMDTKPTSARRPQCYLENGKLKIDHSFVKTDDYLNRKKTSWYRGKSVILGYSYKFLKLCKSDEWKSIVFDKFYSKNANDLEVFSERKGVYVVNDVQKAIISKLNQNKNIFIIEKEPLAREYANLLKANSIIKLPGLDSSTYHYWNITKKYGHWNIKGHIKVSEIITNQLIHRIEIK